MQTQTISDLPYLSLQFLKKRDLLPSPEREDSRGGKMCIQTLYNGNIRGEYVFNVVSRSDGRGGGRITLSYLLDGSPVEYSYDLQRRESNLKTGGYYFVFWYGGKGSTKLYLFNGYFLPKSLLPEGMEYESQSQTKYWRQIDKDGNYHFFDRLFQKGRKVHYRGRLTPYGRKITRSCNQIYHWRDYLCEDPQRRRTLSVWIDHLPEGLDLRSRIRPTYRQLFWKRVGL